MAACSGKRSTQRKKVRQGCEQCGGETRGRARLTLLDHGVVYIHHILCLDEIDLLLESGKSVPDAGKTEGRRGWAMWD